ncbi:universal stress protein [Streptomyces sp. NPDC088725]|uniref:universal stress protein n=1 Tax=Streptomyces sp. NPDC088725 TaxID=3365873 RepID=UPI003828E4EF
MGKIVVGVDGSESSLKALAWAVRQAKLTGDKVEALISWETPTSTWAVMSPAVPADFDPEQLAGKILAESVEKTVGVDAVSTIDQQVVGGHAAQVLVDRSATASLVVVGDRGHSEFAAALLGSVSQHVTHHAKSPVVVVRGERAEI